MMEGKRTCIPEQRQPGWCVVLLFRDARLEEAGDYLCTLPPVAPAAVGNDGNGMVAPGKKGLGLGRLMVAVGISSGAGGTII
jgi:hypothetical protein